MGRRDSGRVPVLADGGRPQSCAGVLQFFHHSYRQVVFSPVLLEEGLVEDDALEF